MAEKRTIQYHIVDAFTDKPFGGNPAAVVWQHDGEKPLTAKEMQLIALEMNLSETAYITDTATPNVYGLRWFTPTIEIDLCGHATLAAYSIVRSVKGDATVTFQTQVSGDLITSITESGLMQLSFPAAASSALDDSAEEVELVRRALPSSVEILEVSRGGQDVVAEVKVLGGAKLEDIKPDHGIIKQIKARGLVVTTVLNTPPSTAGPIFHSRFFAPACGVEEDPVCGSTHTHLAVKFSKKFGTVNQEMWAYHGGPRQGDLWVEWDAASDRVYLRGKSRLMAKGEMYIS